MFNVYAAEYRKKLTQAWELQLIVDCTAFKLFRSATVHNAITVFGKKSSGNSAVGYKETKDALSFSELAQRPTSIISVENLLLNNVNWGLAFKLSVEVLTVISKIKRGRKQVKDLFPEISQGLIAYDKYRGQSAEVISRRAYHYTEKVRSSLKPWLWGEDITPYKVAWNGKEYIDYCDGIANPRQPKFFKGQRVLVREITNPQIYAGLTQEEQYHDPSIIVILETNDNILPLLGILNSKLATFYHFNSSPKATKGAFPKILVNDLRVFPVPDWGNASKLTPLVKKMLELTPSLNQDSKNNRQNRDDINEKINEIVFELYGLTQKERALVLSSL